MKISIDKPGGHSLRAEGRTKDIQTLVNVWWSATAPQEKHPVGFQVDPFREDEDD